jgi:hypothetical protein
MTLTAWNGGNFDFYNYIGATGKQNVSIQNNKTVFNSDVYFGTINATAALAALGNGGGSGGISSESPTITGQLYLEAIDVDYPPTIVFQQNVSTPIGTITGSLTNGLSVSSFGDIKFYNDVGATHTNTVTIQPTKTVFNTDVYFGSTNATAKLASLGGGGAVSVTAYGYISDAPSSSNQTLSDGYNMKVIKCPAVIDGLDNYPTGYSTSTGKMTIPVAGRYFISYSCTWIVESSMRYVAMWLFKNNEYIHGIETGAIYRVGSDNNASGLSTSTTLTLSVGDTIHFGAMAPDVSPPPIQLASLSIYKV